MQCGGELIKCALVSCQGRANVLIAPIYFAKDIGMPEPDGGLGFCSF